MKRLYLKVSIPFLICVFLQGCEKTMDLNNPTCKIVSPQNGDKFIAGDTISIVVNSEDDNMVTGVKLLGMGEGFTNINERKVSEKFNWITKNSDLGNHYITVITTDNDGLFAMDSVLVQIIEDTAVVADFIIENRSQIIGGTIAFTDHSKNNILSWLWDFGDGETSVGQNPTHTYGSIGTYTVSLIVTNNFGTDTTFKYNSIVITNGDGTRSNLKDNEGNIYPIVKIDNQWWMAENLCVTKYNDGGSISNRDDLSQWISAIYGVYRSRNIVGSPGAPFTWYTNDTVFYYNWYCVNSGKLSPKGWHVPSDIEWQEMVDFLGGESIAGSKLKYADTLRWNSPNIGGTNETGFSAIPADHINALTGLFMNTGRRAGFWSGTFNDYQRPSSWCIDNTGPEIMLYKSNHIEDGYPVRCIID